MKYVKTYESFRFQKDSESVNEELLGDIFNAAKGALKNFLGGIMAPFKNLKNDFKKGMKFEEVKTKFITAIDTIQKNTTNNINRAKDEGELNQMVDAFRKEIDEKMADFDKEIKTVRESKIYEGVVQDALIGGRVLFGMFKDEMTRLKVDFDKKFALSKDLNAKKQTRISEIKAIVDGFKKKINDEKLIKAATDKYKTDNKIETTETTENPDLLKSYGVEKKEDLIGKEVRYKTKTFDNTKKTEEQPENIGKLKVLKVTPDGLFFDGEKEDFEKKMVDILPSEGGVPTNPEETVKVELTKIKTDTEKMKKVGEVLPKIIAKIDDDETMKKVTDILA